MDGENDLEVESDNWASGSGQGSESGGSLNEKDAETENALSAVESEEQVQCFVSKEEFESAVKHLRRVPTSELDLETDLEQGYIGGRVIAQCFGEFSQQSQEGYVEILVNDHSQPENITCYISDSLSEMLPSMNSGYLFFLSRVKVKNMHTDQMFSQDHAQCVVAEGTRARMWVIHKDVKRKHIIKWGEKRRMMRSKQWSKGKVVATDRQATTNLDEATDRSHRGQTTPEPTTHSTPLRPDGSGGQQPRRSPRDISHGQTTPQPATHTTPPKADSSGGEHSHRSPGKISPRTQGKPADAGVSTQEEVAHTSRISKSTFPDNFDLPDSAFDDYDDLEADSGEDHDFVLLVPKSSSESGEGSSDETEGEEWTPKRVKVGDTGRQYTYTKIANLRPIEEKVNVFGVVKDFRPAAKSRGTDYYVTMTVVDESSPEEGINCNIFNRDKKRLPHVQIVGDVVCLHRMFVNQYGGNPQLVSRKYSSTICFDGRVGAKIVPRTGSVSYTYTSEDCDRVKQLREWSLQLTKDNEPATSSHTVQHTRSDRQLEDEQTEQQMETERTEQRMEAEQTGRQLETEREEQQMGTGREEQQMETDLERQQMGTGREEQQVGTEREEQQMGTGREEQQVGTEREERQDRTEQPTRCEQEDQQIISEHKEQHLKDDQAWQQPGEMPADQQSETLQQHRGKRVCKLESVTPNLCFDLVCQVVSISSCFTPSRTILSVWDGTRMLLNTPAINTSWCSTTPSPVMLLNSTGLLQNVVIYTKQCGMKTKNIVPGQYVILRNVHAHPVTNLGVEVSRPVVELCMKEAGMRSINALSESDEMVIKLEQELSGAKATQSSLSGLRILNSVSFAVTTTLRSDIQFTSLRDVAASRVVPCKFRCRVKVMGTSPLSVEDMVKLKCVKCGYLTPITRNLELDFTDGCKTNLPCMACAASADTTHQSISDIPFLHCTYLFMMKLEDASGCLVAYISGEDAFQFLPGVPPANFHREQIQRYKLIHRLYSLTGGNYPFLTGNAEYPRPWIECCLLSYHRDSPKRLKHKVYYHLFDTVLYACGQSA